jgi:aspartate aminotransferase-like enzyme/GNAT superfamily N-acetyltransferase
LSQYTFKFATEDWELDQIHRLNYEAFVEEIPQHAPNPERRLIDQFHDQNTYAIVLSEGQIVAMLALRSQRPFSLDKKLQDVDSYLPPQRSLCEIRLLYVKPEHRNGKVMRALMEMVAEYGLSRGHNMAIISGTIRQQRLYHHFGFEPFGPLVGSGDAIFQPMYLSLEAAHRRTPWVRALREQREQQNGIADGKVDGAVSMHGWPEPVDPPVNYLPGPVNIPEVVRATLSDLPVSHRSDQFMADVQEVKQILCDLTGARRVEFLFGSGTLANEAVAAQVSLFGRPGVVLHNGEFGNRLVDQARRWQLEFEPIQAKWGEPFDYAEIERTLAERPELAWLWCVHSETSTGVLNNLERLAAICKLHEVRLCVDCISSIGAVPLSLEDVFLATGTSGKAFGAFSGVAMVFYNHQVAPAPDRLPRYLDLGYYASTDGVPFTISSNLFYALRAALRYFSFDSRRFDATARIAEELRSGLRKLGLTIVAADEYASPAVTSIALPASVSSVWVGDQLQQLGYLLSYKSQYLIRRNWIQVCLMGECQPEMITSLLRVLALLVSQEQPETIGSRHD